MKKIEEIFDKEKNCLALVIRANYSTEKTQFFSAPEYPQQIGIIRYPRGGNIKPHYHNPRPREVTFTQEVLMIRKGIVKVNIYDAQLDFVRNIVLKQNDAIFLIAGGHGFEMLEDTEMLEVKQGPYSGVENDKTNFEGKMS